MNAFNVRRSEFSENFCCVFAFDGSKASQIRKEEKYNYKKSLLQGGAIEAY